MLIERSLRSCSQSSPPPMRVVLSSEESSFVLGLRCVGAPDVGLQRAYVLELNLGPGSRLRKHDQSARVVLPSLTLNWSPRASLHYCVGRKSTSDMGRGDSGHRAGILHRTPFTQAVEGVCLPARVTGAQGVRFRLRHWASSGDAG